MSQTKTNNEATAAVQFLSSANASTAATNCTSVHASWTAWEVSNSGFHTDSAYHTIREKILSFKKFQKNWDGYGADKIQGKAIKQSLQFVFFNYRLRGLTPFSVAPTRDGGIAIEYKFDSIKLVYRILATKKALVVIKNNSHVVSTLNLNSNKYSTATYMNPIVVYRTIVTNLL